MSIPTIKPLRKFVRAGAGAGKTWNLTREVIRLALDHKRQYDQWPKTVLTTFTRKATQELKERLLIYCIKEKPEAIEFVQSTSFLNITTMHGLLSVFLSRYGYAIGLPNQFKIVDAKKADHWRKQILKSLITENIQGKKLQVFEIRRLLQNLKEYERVYWAGESQPMRIEDFQSLMTSALVDLSQRLQQVVGRAQDYTEGEKWTTYWDQLSSMNRCLCSQASWQQKTDALSGLLKELKKPRKSKNNPGLPDEIDLCLREVIDEIKFLATDPQFDACYWKSFAQTLEEFERFAKIFMERLQQKKLQEASLEPDDLEHYSLKLIKTRPDVVKKFSEDCDAWFIDEFQDTSPLQMKILEPMIGNKSCYIVGDPQQSIYLFRGSRSEVFLEKQKQMKAELAELQFLEKNYRSQANLLAFINDFFPKMSSDFSTMEAARNPDEQPLSTVVSSLEGEELLNEVHLMTKQISELLEKGASPKDFCVLTRTHRDLELVQKTFMKQGFPVISHSSSQFYERREVLDAFSLLQLLLSPWDNKNLILFMRSPWVGFRDDEILKIIGEKKENYWPLFKDYFEKNPDHFAGQCLLEAFAVKSTYGMGWVFRKTMLKLGLIEHSMQIDSTGRREANLWKIINLVEKTSREPGGSLLQLVKEGVQSSNLEEFADASDASSPVEPDKISLMTIHASKGLQFKYVFMPFLHKKPRDTTFTDFCNDQGRRLWSLRVPLVEQSQFVGGILEKLYVFDMKKREAEESLRVLYVGMTRAEEKLFLSWTGSPQKKSWALFVEKYLNSAADFPYLLRNKLEGEIEASVYKLDTVEVDASKMFKSLDRFDLQPRDFISGTKEELGSWKKVEGQQDQRWQGVVLHKLFESLKNHDVSQVSRLASLWMPEKLDEVKKALSFVYENKELPLAEIIKSGSVEWGYQKQDKNGLIERRIDLWGVVNNELWIVDYKTGSTHFKNKAFEQLEEYKKALCEYLDWSGEVRLAAVYPFSEQSFVQ